MTKPRSALVMAGGRSERMRSGGASEHKGLRTIMDSPLIEWNLTALLSFGFTDLYVAVSANEPELIRWVNERSAQMSAMDGSVVALLEEKPLGTIGAVSLLPASVTDLVVVNVDNVTDLDLAAMFDRHSASRAAATIASHEQLFRIPFGRLRLEGDRVTAYDEKPDTLVPISSGVYVLSRTAIDAVPRDTRVDVPHLIEKLLASGSTVQAYRHTAAWFDINDELSLAAAEAAIAAQPLPFAPRAPHGT